ncbi:MAG TPA: ion transporter [Gemmatimonadales bacterium]
MTGRAARRASAGDGPLDQHPDDARRRRLHEIVFEADTRAGWLFDIAVISLILTSIAVVMLESVPAIRAQHGPLLRAVEWGFTILFTLEYGLRLYSVKRPLRYALTPLGIIDLLAILPTYLSLLVPGAQTLLVVRVLRLLRIFRIFKLAEYLRESSVLVGALKASRRKITVFLLAVLTIVVIVGTLMYVVEGERHGFSSIPVGVYWAVVTLTTVGYGDLSPATPAGRLLAVVVMLMGYAIIAVPTGIVTMELTRARDLPVSTQACPACGIGGHEYGAKFCRRCGAALG